MSEIGKSICKHLGHLPLALELAAFYLGRHKRLLLADYLKELKKVSALDHTVVASARYNQSPTGYEQDVMGSFQLSFRELTDLSHSERLFLAACQFGPYPINPVTLSQVSDIELDSIEGQEAINDLLDLSLCKQSEDGRITLHRLVREFGLQVMVGEDTETLRSELKESFIEAMRGIDTWSVVNMREIKLELPHIIYAAELVIAEERWPDNFDACCHLAEFLGANGDYLDYFQWCERGLQICEAHQPVDKERYARILSDMGQAYYRQGELNKGLVLQQRALAIRRELFGETHYDVASSLGRVSGYLLDKKDYAGALEHAQQQLNILNDLFSENHPDKGWSHIKIGGVLREQGNLKDALAHHFQAKAIFEDVCGDDHPTVGWSINHICKELRAEKKYSEELTFHYQALEYFERILAISIPIQQKALTILGWHFRL